MCVRPPIDAVAMAPYVLSADQIGVQSPVTLPPLPGVFMPGEPVELSAEQIDLVRQLGLPLIPADKPKPRRGGEQ